MTDTILPHDLPLALNNFPQAQVLSLDCFDTLLWRDAHAPQDIFASLPGITPLQRSWAESRARHAAHIGRGSSEVGIDEIYAQLMPNGGAAERTAAIEAELAAEARHCFAFAPTVELIRAARARGMKVIIVSDTYLGKAQLRALIAASAGEDIAGLVDLIFCSSDFGQSKGNGLYGDVLRKLKIPPSEIVHIGDNPIADVAGVRPFGVNTLHLVQFSSVAEQRLRAEAALGAMVHPLNGGSVRAPQPHRAALALCEPQMSDPAAAFGLSALGPIFSGFERWLQCESDQLAARHGGTVHWLFLMRDGYLPLRVHQASGHQAPGHAVEISRFTATAASFRSARDVRDYCEVELGTNPATLARQLLMSEAEIDALTANSDASEVSLSLLAEMRKGQRARQVVRASREFAQRIAAHIRRSVNVEPRDVLMLIDLGYNGTVQNRIDAQLAEALEVHVAGRYLLLRETDCPGLDKQGFIGLDHYDAHVLEAMCANVAVLEQLCTIDTGSVIDYREGGSPIRKANDIKGRQSVVRERIQSGCLRFARAEAAATIRTAMPDEIDVWRQASAAALGRLMFLPLPGELEVIERFEHDVNLGTTRTVPLFDREIAMRGMRRRGLFYMKGAERMYLPAELSGQGLASRLTLFAHKRFGLPFSHADFTDESVSLPVIYAEGENATSQLITATATHDGYFLAAIPIGDCRFSVALQFGAAWEWLQVESVIHLPVADLLGESCDAHEREVAAAAVLDGIDEVSAGLLHCGDETGFMMVHPPQRRDDTAMMVAAVFRPIAERSEAPLAQTAAQPVISHFSSLTQVQ